METPVRSLRVPDDEWDPAKVRAAERGETVTAVVRRALVEYVAEEDGRVFTIVAPACICHEHKDCPVHGPGQGARTDIRREGA